MSVAAAAARSVLRSSISRATSGASRTASKSPRSIPWVSSPHILRSTVVMSSFCLESMLPYHTATASSLLTSNVAVSRRTRGWNPEGL